MAQAAIAKVHGRRVWDSRGRPTVEVEVALAGGIIGRAIAPAGASTGSGEAVDLRDGGAAFGGLDVRRAVANVERDHRPGARRPRRRCDQAAIDAISSSSTARRTKARLGGNAIVATSLAVLQAAAASQAEPLWRYLARRRRGHASRCPRSRSSAAAPMRRDASTCRISWSWPERVVLRRGARPDRRGLSRRRATPRRARARPGRRRRGRLLAGLRVERGGARHARAGDRTGRLYARRRGRDLARRRRLGVRPRRALPSRTGAARARQPTA